MSSESSSAEISDDATKNAINEEREENGLEPIEKNSPEWESILTSVKEVVGSNPTTERLLDMETNQANMIVAFGGKINGENITSQEWNDWYSVVGKELFEENKTFKDVLNDPELTSDDKPYVEAYLNSLKKGIERVRDLMLITVVFGDNELKNLYEQAKKETDPTKQDNLYKQLWDKINIQATDVLTSDNESAKDKLKRYGKNIIEGAKWLGSGVEKTWSVLDSLGIKKLLSLGLLLWGGMAIADPGCFTSIFKTGNDSYFNCFTNNHGGCDVADMASGCFLISPDGTSYVRIYGGSSGCDVVTQCPSALSPSSSGSISCNYDDMCNCSDGSRKQNSNCSWCNTNSINTINSKYDGWNVSYLCYDASTGIGKFLGLWASQAKSGLTMLVKIFIIIVIVSLVAMCIYLIVKALTNKKSSDSKSKFNFKRIKKLKK